jgi:hypothetical protein
MPERLIILHVREVRRARVRYECANVYLARWGELTSDIQLGLVYRQLFGSIQIAA